MLKSAVIFLSLTQCTRPTSQRSSELEKIVYFYLEQDFDLESFTVSIVKENQLFLLLNLTQYDARKSESGYDDAQQDTRQIGTVN